MGVIAVVVFGTMLGRPREAVYVAAYVAGEAAGLLLVSLIVDRPRPPVVHLDEGARTSAFPSGHTAACIVRYGSIAVPARCLVAPRLVRLVAASAAVVGIVAGCWLYRGRHFPTDLAAGALLGLTWLSTVTYVLLLRHPRRSSGDERSPASTAGEAAGQPG